MAEERVRRGGVCGECVCVGGGGITPHGSWAAPYLKKKINTTKVKGMCTTDREAVYARGL